VETHGNQLFTRRSSTTPSIRRALNGVSWEITLMTDASAGHHANTMPTTTRTGQCLRLFIMRLLRTDERTARTVREYAGGRVLLFEGRMSACLRPLAPCQALAPEHKGPRRPSAWSTRAHKRPHPRHTFRLPEARRVTLWKLGRRYACPRSLRLPARHMGDTPECAVGVRCLRREGRCSANSSQEAQQGPTENPHNY
jgi:hypothetical protein